MIQQAQALILLKAYHIELALQSSPWKVKPEDLTTGRALLDTNDQMCIVVIRTVLNHPPQPGHNYRASRELLNQLAKRHLPYTTDDIRDILQALQKMKHLYGFPAQGLLRALVRPLANRETLTACRADLEQLRATASTWYAGADDLRKFLKRIDYILNGQQQSSAKIRSDDWGERVSSLLTEMAPGLLDPWQALLDHCSQANGGAPGKTWLAQLPSLVEALGKETFCRMVIPWIDAFGKHHGQRLEEENAHLLRGLIWCCAGIEDVTLASSLADAAIKGYRKIPGVGPRSAKIASACVLVLKTMPGLHGAAQLERVRLNVKQATYLKEVEKALDEAARQARMSREELEELTVPTFGLEQGHLRFSIGNACAEIQLRGFTAQIFWFDALSNPRKDAPAEVKRAYKAEINDLKRLREDITHLLGAQRDRLERLPLAERQWSLTTWRERYLDHPLVGWIAKRLIWRFIEGECVRDAIWLDGQLVDAADRPLALSAATQVTAWHPVWCQADEVLAWRTWLERHEVTQPFKQAHREIYLLTDAERATGIYSNRFAAHILRQHQFNALAAARGWRNTLRLMVDDTYPPATLALPHWGLRAEFWIEGAGDRYEADANEAGTYLRLVTDQVRFYPLDAVTNLAHAGGGGYGPVYNWQQRQPNNAPVPIPLERIPPLVFSEVLRDVDLFVGVTSVGNDPTWQDGGPDGRYQTYWHSYSFGDLSATAQTRKSLLERLIPRLAIASRFSIEERFLKVRGDLRSYKIHLGSGNILMEPNDQYLCIVPGRGGGSSSPTDKLYLPFEGDAILSIILSKAFLLAEDRKITDPSIRHQIGK